MNKVDKAKELARQIKEARRAACYALTVEEKLDCLNQATALENLRKVVRQDPIWVKVPMPEDFTCCCGLSVHPSKRNPKAIHCKDCPYFDLTFPTQST
jgi:hypothetical protein